MSGQTPAEQHSERVPYSEPEPEGPTLSMVGLIEVYQRALYEALTRADDDTPEWAHVNHALGVATVMDVDSFLPTVEQSGSCDPAPGEGA